MAAGIRKIGDLTPEELKALDAIPSLLQPVAGVADPAAAVQPPQQSPPAGDSGAVLDAKPPHLDADGTASMNDISKQLDALIAAVERLHATVDTILNS